MAFRQRKCQMQARSAMHASAHHSAGSAAGAARAAPRLSPAWAPHRHQFALLHIYLCELCALQPSSSPQQHPWPSRSPLTQCRRLPPQSTVSGCNWRPSKRSACPSGAESGGPQNVLPTLAPLSCPLLQAQSSCGPACTARSRSWGLPRRPTVTPPPWPPPPPPSWLWCRPRPGSSQPCKP